MANRTDSPLVAALCKTVEKTFGRPIKTPTDFCLVASGVEAKTREHISDSTIKRLWKPALAYDTVSERTLNVLAQYAGFAHFEAFCAHLLQLGIIESGRVAGSESVRAADLLPGDLVSIAWMPDRECTFRYLGELKFEVVEASNSTIRPGDTFFCAAFTKGRQLYVDNLNHAGEIFETFGMGMEHGLTRVSLAKSCLRPQGK